MAFSLRNNVVVIIITTTAVICLIINRLEAVKRVVITLSTTTTSSSSTETETTYYIKWNKCTLRVNNMENNEMIADTRPQLPTDSILVTTKSSTYSPDGRMDGRILVLENVHPKPNFGQSGDAFSVFSFILLYLKKKKRRRRRKRVLNKSLLWLLPF